MHTTIKTGIAALYCLPLSPVKKKTPFQLATNTVAAQQTVTTDAAPATFHIGQQYHGGTIYYIDSTGQHGLIAANTDQGVENAWNNGKNIVTGATATKVGTGLANTNKIVAAQGTTGTYAALLCYDYVSGTFKNWYLPSKAELNLMYKQAAVLGITTGDYWSSSEASQGKAWDQTFDGGYQFKDSKNFTLHVRAVSSF